MNKAVINLKKEPGKSRHFNRALKEFYHMAVAIFFHVCSPWKEPGNKQSLSRLTVSYFQKMIEQNYLNPLPVFKGVYIRSYLPGGTENLAG